MTTQYRSGQSSSFSFFGFLLALVIGAALLPRLAPRDIVETIRSERARKARGEPPIIDV